MSSLLVYWIPEFQESHPADRNNPFESSERVRSPVFSLFPPLSSMESTLIGLFRVLLLCVFCALRARILDLSSSQMKTQDNELP